MESDYASLGRKRARPDSIVSLGDNKYNATTWFNTPEQLRDGQIESKMVLGDVCNWSQYRKEAIARWRRKKGTWSIVRCVFLNKKEYRRIAILRWKNKKCKKALGQSSNMHFHVSMDKKRYRQEAIRRWKRKNCKYRASFISDCFRDAKMMISSADVVPQLGETSNQVSDALNVLMDRNHYRREAIKRWNEKRTNHGVLLPSGDLGYGETHKKSLALGETSDYMNKRFNNKGGKHLLQQVPFAADVLPDVRPCRYCDAVKFHSETENFCCLNGRIVLSSNELPALMQDLLTSKSKEGQSFRTFIRTYNNHFAFTSLGVKADNNLSKRNKGIYTFRVQGQIYHFINNLSPQENQVKNLQLYFHDTDHEVENRLLATSRLSRHLIAQCVQYLQENPYAHFFRNLRDVSNLDEYKIILKTIPGQDQRVFNKPEVSQVAALLIQDEENGEHSRRNIEVKLHSDCSRSVEYYYGCYDPLMFPFGELGWHQRIPKRKKVDKRNRRNVACATAKLISPAAALSAEHLLDMEQNVLDKNSESSNYASVREYYAYKLQIHEIQQFQAGRWISAPEGAWRIYRFPLGDIKPAVIHLALHLQNYQPVTFKKRQRLSNIVENPGHRKTMLTEFFHNNATDRYAQQLDLTYVQYPDRFTWKADKKIWTPRQSDNSIGRIVIAHPSEGERYYLRILLSKIRCPKSYDDLKICNGVKVDTFRESALLRGYLIDDNSQQLCLEEASAYHMPYELRRLFATILVYTCPNNPRQLWSSFEDMMLEDLLKSNKYTHREAKRCALQQVNTFLRSIGRQLRDFDVVPHDFTYNDLEDETRDIKAEKNIVVSEADLRAIHNLNEKQKVAFNEIIQRIDDKKSGAFFIDGPGGTGKTFLYRALLAKIRSQGEIALATATSGIAASLLPGGRTAHSRFKIPLDLTEGSSCRISKQCSLATLIKSSKLIIWDEAPMAKRSAVEALNDLLQDLMSSTEIFGGKVVVLGGDFRQTLPVLNKKLLLLALLILRYGDQLLNYG